MDDKRLAEIKADSTMSAVTHAEAALSFWLEGEHLFEAIADTDLRIDLEVAMVTLTEKQQQALLLLHVGYTESEIATVFGISRDSAHDRLEGSYTRLRKSLVQIPTN